MQFIDTHAHLYLDDFNDDLPEVMRRAEEAGICSILLPAIDAASADKLMKVCENFPVCKPMTGLHPTSVKENYFDEMALVHRSFSEEKYVAVGETGIDLYWDKSFLNQQAESFRQHIRLARIHGLPLVIHSRDALDVIFELLETEDISGLKGVFHCFPGNAEEARRVLDLGFFLGIGGVVTFKKNNMTDVVRMAGPEHIVLETDAPFLAPVPYRGKRNEPAMIRFVAESVASITGTGLSAVAEITTANAVKLFNLQL
jgi:TatD DNase family protein